uniref:subtilisin n=2 Tax=Ditylum brightwellii TaxID=49249 RepID=A0A7S4S990_9STRA
MKFASFGITAVTASLLSRFSHAGFPDDEDGSLNRHLARKLGKNDNGNGIRPEEDNHTIDLIVKYKNEDGHIIADSYDKTGRGRDISVKYHTEVITTNKEYMEALKNDPNIESVEVDSEIYALPNMRGYVPTGERGRRLEEETPYGIDMVNPEPRLEQGIHPIKVCVIDTGYDNNHTDLPDLDANDGFSPYDGQTWDHDGHGHGTHCAGTIGAIGGNAQGVTSLNPDPTKFKFFISKGLRDTGSGTGSGLLSAVESCIENEANIISMSLGGGGFSDIMNTLFNTYYEDQGVLIIAAAGNDGNSAYNYPASYASIMSVAAVDMNGVKASFSQYNDQVESEYILHQYIFGEGRTF